MHLLLTFLLCACVGMVMPGTVWNSDDISESEEMDVYSDEADDDQSFELGSLEHLGCHSCSKIAFSAYLSDDQDLGNGQHLKFDKVILNDGNTYSPNLGTFTAPCSGVYHFTVVVAQRHINEVRVKIVLNGVNQVDAIAKGMHKYHDAQGTNTLNLHVKKGQSVYVEAASRGHVEGNDESYRYTTFSGHLLYARN